MEHPQGEEEARRERRQDPIVTSGESGEGVLEDSSSDDGDFDEAERHRRDQDLLYDENADAEDEAYVYNVLRSGSAEPSHAQLQKEDGQQPPSTPNKLRKNNIGNRIVKPRNSDAVLSCPCCLSIVCMDCQQHERYSNQYRAMFVMNIMVRWDLKLKYDAKTSQLVPFVYQNAIHPPDRVPNENNNHSRGSGGAAAVIQSPNRVPDDDDDDHNGNRAHSATAESEEVYYTVCCANCHTQVASLDMTDEIYHFYGCVASA